MLLEEATSTLGAHSDFRTCASILTPSAVFLIGQDIMRLKRLVAASGSSSTRSAGLAADSSTLERPPSSQSGTRHESFAWFWPSLP